MPTKLRWTTAKQPIYWENKYSPWWGRELIRDYLETQNGVRTPKGGWAPVNNCLHWRTLSLGVYEHHVNRWFSRDTTGLEWAAPSGETNIIQKALDSLHISLDFIEDNQFELIPFLMDFDQSLSLLGSLAARRLDEVGYGGITWGLGPMLSDVKSLWNTGQAINGKVEQSYEKVLGKRITRTFPIEGNYRDLYCSYEFSGVTRIQGYLSGANMFPEGVLGGIQMFLDELGVHPDLRTLWDIVPASFVVDYFLPVGDFLETLHPRGWFNPTFVIRDGSWTIKARVTQTWLEDRTGVFDYNFFYRRNFIPDKIPARPNTYPEWQMPDMLELFNTAYVKGLNERRIAEHFGGRIRR